VKLGIIGGGVMGEAILSCLLSRGEYAATDVYVSEPNPDRRDFLAHTYGVITTDKNIDVTQGEVLLLAVKPQSFWQATQGLSNIAVPLIISILAGVSLSQLASVFADKAIVRAMPNTPAQVGYGVTALSASALVTPEQMGLAKNIFAAIGEVVELPESLIDAVTGLSGSGPGFLAVIIEAMIDGGVAAGLPRAIATKLAIQTMLGTAQLLIQADLHPAVLKDRVTSPGGTTITGITQLELSGVRSGMIEAIVAATKRSQELGSN
jgi:pyrroline-5-carboxylate reductase